MLDMHITLLETCHLSHSFHLHHFGLLMVLGLETGSLTHWLPGASHWRVKLSGIKQSKILSLAGLGRFGHQRVNSDWSLQYNIDKLKDLQVVCWRKRLIEIKTFFQQQMLNKRRQTCMPQILTLLVR